MSDEVDRNALKAEIDGGNSQRATLLATSFALPEAEIRDLQRKALWQMAAQHKNAAGTKKLSQEYGFTKGELRAFLESGTQRKRNEGTDEVLKACYDYSAGKHLDFEAWLDELFRNWSKLPS